MSNCLFCKIVAREITADIVYEDDRVVAFKDISPAAPVHLLVIPRRHIASLNDAEDNDFAIVGHLHRVIKELAQKTGIAATGYRVINNCGKDAGQAVSHLHFHLLGGKPLPARLGD